VTIPKMIQTGFFSESAIHRLLQLVDGTMDRLIHSVGKCLQLTMLLEAKKIDDFVGVSNIDQQVRNLARILIGIHR